VPGTSPYDGSELTFSTLVLGIGECLLGEVGPDWASEKCSSESEVSGHQSLDGKRYGQLLAAEGVVYLVHEPLDPQYSSSPEGIDCYPFLTLWPPR
jgi:hypothetical protein